jgi:autotransporter-associated beta strand protein
MKLNHHLQPRNRNLFPLGAALLLLLTGATGASAASITFSAPANCSADTDIKAGGGNQLAAFTWGTGGTVNGVAFTSTTLSAGPIGQNLNLSTFSGANATAFGVNAAPFNTLSSAYTNMLRGSVFNSTANTFGTVTLSNLVVGHTYFVQLWVGDPRAGTTTNRATDVSSGGSPVRMYFNSTLAAGGVGQHTYGSFTADAPTQDILVDSSAVTSPWSGVPQVNAIQLRDTTGVWSGTTDGNWVDTDNTSQNFSGANYVAVKAATTNVYFSDKDANGAAVATSSVTVGSGGVTGANAIFNNNSVAYTLNSADANGITGAYGVTVSGSGAVNLNGANTFTGNTVVNNGTLTLGNASAIGGSTAVILNNNGILDATALGSLSLASGQSLRGFGTVRGSVTAASGSTLVPGGVGSAGTLTITNNLALNGQTITFDLAFGPSGGDKIAVGNVLTVNSTCTISLNYLFGSLGGGTYTLMTFASKAGAGTFVLDTSYPGVTLNVNPTSVTLTVGSGGGTSGTWTNLLGGSWVTAANWQGGVIATNVDGIADFSTLNITAARSVTINSTNITIGHLIFGDTVQDANWTLSTGTNYLAVSTGSPKIIVNSGQNATISAALYGNQGFTKLGAGTLTLSGANRMTNAVNVLAGTLTIGASNPFGPVTNSTQVPVTLSNAVLTVNGAFLLTNNITLPAGTSNYISAIPTSAGLYGSQGNPLSGSGTLVINIVGANNPRLNGGDNQNFTGKLVVNTTGAGGLLTGFDDDKTLSKFGYAGSSNAVYVLNGSASSLFYMGTSDWVAGGHTGCTNYLGELSGSATLFANNGRSGTTTLEIGGLNTISTFSGAINDNHLGATPYTPMIIRKVGSGSLTLAGTSTYTGATDVRGGMLAVSGSLGNTPISIQSGATFRLDGSIASATVNVLAGGTLTVGSSANLGSTAITLNGLMDVTAAGSLGSATLSGSGVVTGSLALASSSINPGPIGSAGQLTIVNGDFSATGGTLQFDLSATPASGNDFLSVSGNMNFNTPGVTISINKLAGTLGSGTYVLAQCGGTINGSVGNLTLIGAGPLDVLQISGNQLQLVISPVINLTWRGDGLANLWDIGISTTWVNGTTPSTYADGNAVTFDNSGGTNPIVNIATNVSPAIVSVAGTTNYTLLGPGSIADGASLIKSGTSTLTIANTNVFTGGLFLNSGTVSVGNAGTNGSIAGNINNNAALVFNTPADQAATNSISGPGSFSKQGVGQLFLTGNSTMTGPTTISAGTLSIGDGVTTSGALGTGVVTNNAMLDINRPDSLTMSNAIRNLGGIIHLGAGTTIINGVLSGSGSLTNAAGTLELGASNTYSGPTYINGGNVMLRNMAGFGTSSVFVDDASGSAINIAPTAGQTNLIPNNIRLPAAATSQFVVTDLSLSTMTTVRLTGLISGGQAATDTRLVNGGGTPAGNPRLTIVLENPANSFTMTPDVYSGCLAFNSDGALGDPNNGIIVQSTAQFPGTGFTDATTLVGLRFNANGITLNPNRTIQLVGTEIINVQSFNGAIAGPITGVGLAKRGSGILALSGPCSLTGSSSVVEGTLQVNNSWTFSPISVASGATLGGTGSIMAPVTILSGGTLSPGASIGTLVMTNTLTLSAGSTTVMEINAGTVACDQVVQVSTLTYNGTLTVTNTGGTLAIGQTFPLFSATTYAGNFTATNLPALNSSMKWQWTPATGTLAVVAAVNTTPTNLTVAVSAGNLNLSWPADHTGWRLQAQTNSQSIGLRTNWATVPGSTTVNSMSFPMDPANGAVFFRMVYP